MPNYVVVPEHQLTEREQGWITALRNASFPDHKVERSYYKQLPHFRILAVESEQQLLGHVGVDYRVIRLGERAVTILGVIDLCVSDGHRRRGIASRLLNNLCALGKDSAAEFVVLCTDDTRLYSRHGFKRTSNVCSWLRIDEHQNFGVARESLADCLMVKALGPTAWTDDDVDLLGYLF